MILISIILIIDGKKNPFFTQYRMGKARKQFLVFKFRTIANSSDKYKFEPNRTENITPICKFMRLHRIDEIPQLLNVLFGNMSIIGPRPDPVSQHFEMEKHIDFYDNRLLVLPGLTGLAQVSFKHCSTVEDGIIKYNEDIKYIQNLSLKMDLYIFFKTFGTVISGSGAK